MNKQLEILEDKKELGFLLSGDEVVELEIEHMLALLQGKIIRKKDHGNYYFVVRYRKPNE